MQDLKHLLAVCSRYKKGDFDIEEFQSRVHTSSIPDHLSKEFLNDLAAIDNRLEHAIYCESPSSREEKGRAAADELILAIRREARAVNKHI